MKSLFEDPYKYVLDTSALIDLKRNYPPKIFKGVWDKFNKACDDLIIISTREVLNEINRGSDYLTDWVKDYEKIFFIPTAEELKLVGLLQDKYPNWIDYNSDRPSADPFIIASAHFKKLTILTHELPHKNLPKVAKDYKLECVTLTQLFEIEKWEFE